MQITRRFFLRSSGALAAYLGLAPVSALAEAVRAASAKPMPVTPGKTLVAIFLRGGIDGLNLIVPHADEHYYRHRQGLAIPRPGQGDNAAIDLDHTFGLHPRMAALKPLFDQGHAAALHAVGYDKNTRSHFEEQDTWETGVMGNTLGSDGWLNRHLQTSTGAGPLRAVALSDTLPRVLRGDARAFAIRGLEDLGMPDMHGDAAQVAAALEHAYRTPPEQHRGDARDLLAATGQVTLDAMAQLQKVTAQPYTPAAEYPGSEIGQRLQAAARLIKANLGVEVIEIDFGGWDTHQYQGNGGGGNFADLVGQLADALAAFHRDMGDHMADTLVVTMSDFGRTARENGTGGTDHGWGNVMLAVGGPITARAGRRKSPVITDWPGLAPDQLKDGRDLAHTRDFRDVLAEVTRHHLGNPNLEVVLPGHTFNPVGLLHG